MKKLKLYHLFTVFLMSFILYLPINFITYYLTDFSYQDIMNIEWVYDNRCYYPEESESDEYNYHKDCSICEQLSPYNNNGTHIKDGNGYLIGLDLMRKVYLKQKPDYFPSELLTGGELHLKDFKSGITCTFYSYE
ncbi:MAG: hypothetical protein J6582_07115 [Snodgrassella sp.]|uniref:hypothetical protein n=1 Tax=Snodgrassella sp. TaxID=2815304 RepID=UPI00258979B0|nr:hypothetical protein [Snodgrassella sp.]MCO6520794.1 hypothetical protein [Snodgrassella sp.]